MAPNPGRPSSRPVLDFSPLHIEHEPGEELYVDWAGDKFAITDPATGRTAFHASIFVAVCPYSGLLFAKATRNEKMANWIDCHVATLDYLGARTCDSRSGPTPGK